MPLTGNILPYGLRSVVLYPVSSAGIIGTGVALPASRTFSFSEAEDFEELRGDDGVVAIRGKGPKVSWDLESGGITFAAYTIMAGGTIVQSGTTPAMKASLKKLGTDARPYFAARGKALSDSGGDFHGLLFKARATDTLEANMSDGEWLLTSASGEAIPATVGTVSDGSLYEFRNHETALAVPTTWD